MHFVKVLRGGGVNRPGQLIRVNDRRRNNDNAIKIFVFLLTQYFLIFIQ